MSEIIVSVAVISQRISNLVPVLESLLHHQSRPPDRVVIWISSEPFLLDEGCDYSDLPEQVRSWHEDRVIEVRTTANTGPHRKMIPLLKEHRKDPDPPILITADDDTIYPVRWVEALVDAHRASGAAICFRGRVIARTEAGLKPYDTWPLIPAYDEVQSQYVLATGREGLLIRANMFDQRTFTDGYMEYAKSRCDVWIAAGLIAGGTEMYKLSMARIFPDPRGLRLARDHSLPRPSPAHPALGNPSTRNEKTDLWRYNRDKNDAIIDTTFSYFDIIGGT